MKFSIVTISFNQGRFLEQAIRSVIEQDYPDIEYIVVDPGSTDGSREIIERYRDRIAKVIFERDKGPADGLNKGFAHATGDILGFINADDYFEPYAFARVAKFFRERPEINVVSGAIKLVDRNGYVRWRKRMSDRFNLGKYADGRCWIGQQATFFRSAAYGKDNIFNIENKTCWDAELFVCMALNGNRFDRIFKVLGNFRIYEESISGSGQLREGYKKDHERIINIIHESVLTSNSTFSSILLKSLYKINIKRHLVNCIVK